jgi:hypothetical protein
MIEDVVTPCILSTLQSGVFLHPKHPYWSTGLQRGPVQLTFKTEEDEACAGAVAVNYSPKLQLLRKPTSSSTKNAEEEDISFGTSGVPVPPNGGILGIGPKKDEKGNWLNPVFHMSGRPVMTIERQESRIFISPCVSPSRKWCWSNMRASGAAYVTEGALGDAGTPCTAILDVGSWRSVLRSSADMPAALPDSNVLLLQLQGGCELVVADGAYYLDSSRNYSGTQRPEFYIGLSAGQSTFCVDMHSRKMSATY